MVPTRSLLPLGLIVIFFGGAYLTLRPFTSSNQQSQSSYVNNVNNVNNDQIPLGPSSSRPPKRPPLFNTLPEPPELFQALVPTVRWLVRQPIKSYRDSLAVESARCPSTALQSNLDQLSTDSKWWAKVKTEELSEERYKVAQEVVGEFGFALEGKEQSGTSTLGRKTWEKLFGDRERGLVFTAGNKDTMTRLLASLTILRKTHGCELPAEIFGFSHELEDLGSVRDEFEALGDVNFRTITCKPKEKQWKQFQIKGEAIARSSFTEVLYLDSDNIAVRDPTYLFDTPLFKENGIVLWPDLTKDSPANPIWRTLSTPCNPHEWQADSGQILVSKVARSGLNLAALLIAESMQRHSDFWFGMSGGDKDTFRYAFHFLSLPYSSAPHWVSLAGTIIATFHGHQFCGHSIVQYGLSAREWDDIKDQYDSDYTPPAGHAPPLFVHANLLKHSGYHNAPGSTWETLKSADPDLIRSSNSKLLQKDIRGRVYNHRGMCSDLWDAEAAAREGMGAPPGGAFETGRFAMWDFQESWGGLMRGIERTYYEDAGGVAGAW